ncbi:MAG: addiction module protein [Rhodoferax sp.]|nr:addiction module protein [Rhodoferax sp.]
MSDLVLELSQQAQSLGAQDRARLAELLLDSIHLKSDSTIDDAWDAELLRRIDEVDRGIAVLVSAKDAFAQVRRAIQ